MDQQTFEDAAAEAASSVLFEGGASSVLFEAGAMDDSFDTSTDDGPFDEDADTVVEDLYTDDSQASTIDIMCGRQLGASLPRSFASSMLERCDEADDRSLLVPGFRRVEETPLTTKVGALNQTVVRQSELYVAKQPVHSQFVTVQVEFLVYNFVSVSRIPSGVERSINFV